MHKTKEEILDREAAPYNCRHIGRYRDSALAAMDEYAKEICFPYVEKLNAVRSLITLHEWPSLGHLAAAVLGEIEGNKKETT